MAKKLRVLAACEFSAVVRDAFAALGHDAWSCDLLPSWKPGNHIQDDVLKHLDDGWDLMVGFPPCTNLCCSGARHFVKKQKEQQEGADFFMALINAPIEKICIENPVGVMSTRHRKPDQIIQPWMFGHGEVKTTCLWLKNLPKLVPTEIVDGRYSAVLKCKTPPGEYKNRGKYRSVFYEGWGRAMADQWGGQVDDTE